LHPLAPAARGDGLVGGGSYAEYVVTHEDEAVAVPAGMSLETAAAVPEAFITAHDALFTQMRLWPARRSSSTPSAAASVRRRLQLARAAGARVIGTQRSAWKLERALSLGLDVAIDTGTEDFVEVVLRETSAAASTACWTSSAGTTWAATSGRWPCAAGSCSWGWWPARSTSSTCGCCSSRRATITGTVLRARSLDEKIAAARAFARDVAAAAGVGRRGPVIDEVLPLADAARAHAIVAENRNFGKVGAGRGLMRRRHCGRSAAERGPTGAARG
jgi:NADPH:quinone reductase